MIKKIRIKNYKCYGASPADFELSRINFIYGDNSVGKSTFLQCIANIFQMYEHGESSISVSEELNKISFKNTGADKIDVLFRTGDDSVWRYKVIGNELALRDVNNSIVPKDVFFASVPWLKHLEASRPLRTDNQKSSLLKFVDTRIDVNLINSMLSRLKVGYKCIDKYTLSDTVLGVDNISVNDVGTGIVGIFDTLQSLSFWKEGLLLLEEPDANVNEHQMEALTTLLVEEAKKRFDVGGQLFVEFHSELVMLVIRNLLKHKVISTDDISIFVVTKNLDGSIVNKIPMDEYGNIMRPWPNGFFIERTMISDSYYND